MDTLTDSNHLLSYRLQPKMAVARPPFTCIATLLLRDPVTRDVAILPATQAAISHACQRYGHEGCLHTVLAGGETYADLIHHIERADQAMLGREASTIMLMMAATPEILEQWLILARKSHQITPIKIEHEVVA